MTLKNGAVYTGNGSTVSEMASDPKCGLMVLNMKDTGKTTRLMDRENWFTLTEMFMKDNG